MHQLPWVNAKTWKSTRRLSGQQQGKYLIDQRRFPRTSSLMLNEEKSNIWTVGRMACTCQLPLIMIDGLVVLDMNTIPHNTKKMYISLQSSHLSVLKSAPFSVVTETSGLPTLYVFKSRVARYGVPRLHRQERNCADMAHI
jgi:hypothetical protein